MKNQSLLSIILLEIPKYQAKIKIIVHYLISIMID